MKNVSLSSIFCVVVLISFFIGEFPVSNMFYRRESLWLCVSHITSPYQLFLLYVLPNCFIYFYSSLGCQEFFFFVALLPSICLGYASYTFAFLLICVNVWTREMDGTLENLSKIVFIHLNTLNNQQSCILTKKIKFYSHR